MREKKGPLGKPRGGATEANDNLQKHLDVNTEAYSEEQLKTYQKQLNVLENKVETAQNTLSRAKATQDLRKKWLDSKDNKDYLSIKKLKKIILEEKKLH